MILVPNLFWRDYHDHKEMTLCTIHSSQYYCKHLVGMLNFPFEEMFCSVVVSKFLYHDYNHHPLKCYNQVSPLLEEVFPVL